MFYKIMSFFQKNIALLYSTPNKNKEKDNDKKFVC